VFLELELVQLELVALELEPLLGQQPLLELVQRPLLELGLELVVRLHQLFV
jgi:hypothetical protein